MCLFEYIDIIDVNYIPDFRCLYMLELLSKHDLEKKSKTFRKLKKYIRHDMVIRKEINIFHKLLIKEYKLNALQN